MKYLYLILFVFFVNSLVSCSSDQEDVSLNQPTLINTADFKVSKVTNPQKLKNAFGGYSVVTRTMGVPNSDMLYDFSNAEAINVKGKEATIFNVPAKDKKGLEHILAGIGDENEIQTKMYFEETSSLHYTLYNQDKEPIFDVIYDDGNEIINITKVYGNDAIVIPTTRARLSRRAWSMLCNGAIAVGTTALGFIGAVPLGGATIGMAVCCYVAGCALC